MEWSSKKSDVLGLASHRPTCFDNLTRKLDRGNAIIIGDLFFCSSKGLQL